MPAPQASVMQQLARLKFSSFGLKVPTNWKEPVGDTAAQHYRDALKPHEKTTEPAQSTLFQPASFNKYHTDTHKMHVAKIGGFIDTTCSAICSAWRQWQATATMSGVVIAGPVASAGVIAGVPWTPLILAEAPKGTPNEMKFTRVIASVIGNAWQVFTATVKIPGLPLYPAYAAVPTPVAPPTPNVPVPFSTLVQVPVSLSAQLLKTQMIAELGDPKAPFSKELFESISDAFEKCYNAWKVETMVTNLMPVATGGTPVSPLPAAGTAMMTPGGFT